MLGKEHVLLDYREIKWYCYMFLVYALLYACLEHWHFISKVCFVFDTDTYNYIQLCNILKLVPVSKCRVGCFIGALSLYLERQKNHNLVLKSIWKPSNFCRALRQNSHAKCLRSGKLWAWICAQLFKCPCSILCKRLKIVNLVLIDMKICNVSP